MQTDFYRIRIEACNQHGQVLAAFEQAVTQQSLRDNRPARMKEFIHGVVERFLRGHRGIEKALPKRKKRKPMKMRAAIPFDPMNNQPFSEGPQHD